MTTSTTTDLPHTISCLCVTRNRPVYLRRAINCFLSQTYERKELVVVHPGDPGSNEVMKSVLNVPGIVEAIVPEDRLMSLGELRNFAVQRSTGTYFCQWDDDDWYHCSRLAIQMEAIIRSKKNACALAKQFIYDCTANKAYLSPIGPWAGSILCKKAVTGQALYPAKSKAEDSDFLLSLLGVNAVFPLLAPNIYIYTCHWSNTWDKKHFENIFRQSKELSRETTELFRNILDNRMSNEEASAFLDQQNIADEIDYFYFTRPSVSDLAGQMLNNARAISQRLFSRN